jgi:type IV secretory pathway ATPase VirB11/archaellum biosynthesis ATPase
MFSMAALAERVREQFMLEYAGTAMLAEADTPAKRARLVLGATDYVIAVETIAMSLDEKAALLERVYSELFGYGALDRYFADPSVTTFALHGAERTAIRYGHGDLQDVGAIFDDADQLQTIIGRVLTDAGVDLSEGQPIVETGLTIGERRVSLSVISPSLSLAGAGLVADIRLHPAQPKTLDDLIADGMCSPEAGETLRALVGSKYGLIIAGETETGKTTLMNALALTVDLTSAAAVERSGEMRLPEGTARFQPFWGSADAPPVTFGEQIMRALAGTPSLLLIDEVRSDEPSAIAPLLEAADAPRQWWTFRGAPDHKRMQSALGMLARRAQPGSGEALVHELYARLPFVISVARIQGRLQLFSIAEWQSRIDTDYPDYVQLYRYQEGQARRTEAAFARWL